MRVKTLEDYGPTYHYPCSETYRPCHCGDDCNWLGIGAGQCWGDTVREDCGDEGDYVHVCQGHASFPGGYYDIEEGRT